MQILKSGYIRIFKTSLIGVKWFCPVITGFYFFVRARLGYNRILLFFNLVPNGTRNQLPQASNQRLKEPVQLRVNFLNHLAEVLGLAVKFELVDVDDE